MLYLISPMNAMSRAPNPPVTTPISCVEYKPQWNLEGLFLDLSFKVWGPLINYISCRSHIYHFPISIIPFQDPPPSPLKMMNTGFTVLTSKLSNFIYVLLVSNLLGPNNLPCSLFSNILNVCSPFTEKVKFHTCTKYREKLYFNLRFSTDVKIRLRT
jgi:hypothetical protein